MESSSQLGFPAPLLGMRPVRLPVLFDDGRRIVLAKPVGVLVQEDGWFRKLPVLVEAIRHQSRQGKQEFQRLGIGEEGLWAVTDLDPELHGPVLFSRDREDAEALRSAVGSGAFEFSYLLLTRGHVTEESLTCDLPVARHRQLPRILVSHTKGK
jgi:23S rRNA-/tRNA-specific pseudouridylate synthase